MIAVSCGTTFLREGRTKWRNLSRFLFSNEDIVIDKFVTYSDGEFYMDFTTDFLKYFGKLYIVHLNPMRMELNEKKRTRQFQEFAVRGKWISNVNAGGTSNFAANTQYRYI